MTPTPKQPVESKLKYGGVPKEECEVTLRLDAVDEQIHVCSTWATWSRKFEKRYGTPVKFTEREGFVTVAFWKVPLKVLSLRALGSLTKKTAPRPDLAGKPVGRKSKKGGGD